MAIGQFMPLTPGLVKFPPWELVHDSTSMTIPLTTQDNDVGIYIGVDGRISGSYNPQEISGWTTGSVSMASTPSDAESTKWGATRVSYRVLTASMGGTTTNPAYGQRRLLIFRNPKATNKTPTLTQIKAPTSSRLLSGSVDFSTQPAGSMALVFYSLSAAVMYVNANARGPTNASIGGVILPEYSRRVSENTSNPAYASLSILQVPSEELVLSGGAPASEAGINTDYQYSVYNLSIV